MNIKFNVILLLVLSIYSCKNDPTALDPSLDIRLAKEPEKLNPILYANATAREVNQYIFLPLADYDPTTLKLTPVLIKSIPVEEEGSNGIITYTVELLPEAIWDDGKPITALDYLFTLKTIMHPSTTASAYRGMFQDLAGVTVDPSNNKRFSISFKKYFMLARELALSVDVLPRHIYDPQNIMDKYNLTALISEKEAEALVAKDTLLQKYAATINGIKYTKETVVGSGPYQLKSWTTSQNIVLEKKQNYWAKNIDKPMFKQGPEKIIFHFIPDEVAAIARLKAGEIDFVSGLSQASFDALQKEKPNLSYQRPQLMKTYILQINNNDVILKSKSVRQALATITNVDQMIATLEGGLATKVIGPINPAKHYYNKNIKAYTVDQKAAIKLLNDDGWSDSNNNGIIDKKINGQLREMKLPLLMSGELGKNIALIVQAEAKKVGIDIEPIKKEYAQMRKEDIEPGKYSLALIVSSQEIGYEDLSQRYHSRNAEIGESNTSFYKNAKVDSLIDKINTTKNEAQRDAQLAEVQQVIYQDLPNIFLYSPKERMVISEKWQGKTNAKRPGYQANTFLLNH